MKDAVHSSVKAVEGLAKARKATIDHPLSTLVGCSLQTIQLDDPDGIANYLAQVAAGSNEIQAGSETYSLSWSA
ncbi:MAG: hypothetical protein P8Y80_05750 [Acidobacteriota bacterium]|jgi:hypothetical protein